MRPEDEPAHLAAERVYADFIESVYPDFDACCEANPELVDRLRRIREQHREFLERAPLLQGEFETELAAPRGPAVLPPMELQIGAVVGSYRLTGKIGEGGMGQVWTAEHVSLKRPTALKFIREDRLGSRSAAYFDREARAGSRSKHPGIVQVHDYGRCQGHAWIAMELVEGGRTLQDLVRETRPETIPEDHDHRVARLVLKIAEAMQVAHDAGVVHRDLTPRNILLDESGAPLVTDFGLARILDESAISTTGEVLGTSGYMSPEQIKASPGEIDHRTDVFSLGVILYELLTLRRPFEGDNREQIREKILHADPVDPREIRSLITRDLTVICGKTLEKDPGHRYASMRALAADLRAFLAGEPIAARPAGWPRRSWAWVRRNPVRVARLIGVAAILAVILGAITSFARTVSEVYSIAERARDSVAAGELPRAYLAYEALRDSELAPHLPGLSDDLEEAEEYRVGEGEEPSHARCCDGFVQAQGEDQLREVHNTLLRFLLTAGSEDRHEVWIRFLCNELGRPSEPRKRLLAAETICNYMTQMPIPWGEMERAPYDSAALQRSLLAVLEEPDLFDRGDLRATDATLMDLKRYAAGACSGIGSRESFEALLSLFSAKDGELRRVAVKSTKRIWYEARDAERLEDLPVEMLDAWRDGALLAIHDSSNPVPLLEVRDVEVILYFHAWTRLLQGAEGPELEALREEGDRSLVARIYGELSNYLHGRPVGRIQGEDPTEEEESVEGAARQGFLAWEIPGVRLDACKDHLEPHGQGYSRYTNLWDDERVCPPIQARVELKDVLPPIRRGLHKGWWKSLGGARFCCTKDGPIVRSLCPATNGLLTGATSGAQDEFDYVQLDQPGRSELELTTTIPPDAQYAEVTVDHGYCARYNLPYLGSATIAVTAGPGGKPLTLPAPVYYARMVLPVDLSPWREDDEFRVSIKLLSATSPYWIDRVDVLFLSYAAQYSIDLDQDSDQETVRHSSSPDRGAPCESADAADRPVPIPPDPAEHGAKEVERQSPDGGGVQGAGR